MPDPDERLSHTERAPGQRAPGERAPGERAPGPARPRRRRFRWLGRLLGAAMAVGTLGLIVGAGAAYAVYIKMSADLPDVAGLTSYQPPVMSRVFADDGRQMAELATERRIFVPIVAIPKLVQDAFVSAEDQNFWTHRGVDPLAILRASVQNARNYGSNRRPIGASTITQQVAKNMLLDAAPTLSRKAREAILATRIEQELPKSRTLELYLNEIFLGAQSYGVAAAAQTYFGKALDQLAPTEAAFLAALPKGPNNYNPYKYPDAARARRDWVLDRMTETGAIGAADAQAGKALPVITGRYQRPEAIPASEWFTEEVRRRLIERFGADTVTGGGLLVRTSMDPRLQVTAEKVLRDGLVTYDRKFGGFRGPFARAPATGIASGWPLMLAAQARPPGMPAHWQVAIVTEVTPAEARVGWVAKDGALSTPHPGLLRLADLGWAKPVHDGHVGGPPRKVSDILAPGDLVMIEPGEPDKKGREVDLLRQVPLVQGALASVDVQTGRVLAMVGGWSYELSQFNRATQANRQPGSSFKPFVYLTALEQGFPPSQLVLDAPFTQDLGAAGKWSPENYTLDYHGPTPMRVALEKSLNLVTVRIAQRVGMDAVADTATAFHEVEQMPRVLPASLGAVDTTVLREAGAYAGLAAGGRAVVPTLIDSVQDRDGHIVARAGGVTCECDDPALPDPVDARPQVADPQSDFQIVTMMQGVVSRGTGFAAGQGLGRPIAGKTGTSEDFRDAWFAGFTPDIATVVWIGFDMPQSLGEGETGGSVAAPIFREYMKVATQGRPVLQFVPPPGVTLAPWDSGYGRVTDAFKEGQEPGASGPAIGGGDYASRAPGAAGMVGGGIDTGLGGLY